MGVRSNHSCGSGRGQGPFTPGTSCVPSAKTGIVVTKTSSTVASATSRGRTSVSTMS